MEIYVKRVAIESGVGSSGQNLIAPNYETQPEPYIDFRPPTTQPPSQTRIPPRSVHVTTVPVAPLSLPEAPPYPRPSPVDDEIGSDFENIDAIPEEDLQTGDEFEGGNWDSDHLEGVDEDGTVSIRGEYMNMPLSGRTDTHPFESMLSEPDRTSNR